MKKLIAALIFATFSLSVHSGDIATANTYFGPIQGVSVGFWGHVGVGLPSDQTCHGQRVVVLLNTHSKYKEILSSLLTAEASKSSVKFYFLGSQTITFGGSYSYCVITEAALGDFPGW